MVLNQQQLCSCRDDYAGGGDTLVVMKNQSLMLYLKSGGSKLAVVKLVKELTGKGLKDAKELVDSAPTTVKGELCKR